MLLAPGLAFIDGDSLAGASSIETLTFGSQSVSSPTIFYSWQSDLLRTTTRDVIATAFSLSVATLASHPRIVDSPRLDQDTQNVGGTPEIAGTTFRKIERAAVFVGGTPIGRRPPSVPPATAFSIPNILAFSTSPLPPCPSTAITKEVVISPIIGTEGSLVR